MTNLPPPSLDTKNVLEALSALRQAVPLRRDHPLGLFLTVQSRAMGSGLRGPVFMEACIYRTLSAEVRFQLRRHRGTQERPCVHPWDLAICDLARDFRVGNVEREAWSLLYYRFVCFELDLSIEDIARIVCQTVRTVHRRQQIGLVRLTHRLLRREQLERIRWQQALLRSQPPITVPSIASCSICLRYPGKPDR